MIVMWTENHFELINILHYSEAAHSMAIIS